MMSLFSKRVAGFPPWCIAFTFLYTLFYCSWILDYRQKHIYPLELEQVTYNNNHSKTATSSCNDPVYFVYPYHHKYLLEKGKQFLQNMIVSYHFTNTTCRNTRFDSNRTALCAKYNTQLHSNEFCNGGHIIYQPNPAIFKQIIKSNINKLLTGYCNTYHKTDNVCNFNLLTYNLDNLQERIQFLTQQIDCQKNISQPDKTWVFKELKHEGNGIHFYNNHQLIYSVSKPSQIEEKKYYNKCANIPAQNSEYFEKEGFDYIKINDGKHRVSYDHLTVQEFISNPLLINNRAFHIRTLLLLATNGNLLIVLQYPRWQIFRNPLEYDNTHLDGQRLRSNYHVAEESPTALVDENGTVLFNTSWGYNRFLTYLNEEHSDQTDLENKMQKDMKSITATIFKSRSYYNRRHKLNMLNRNKPFDNKLQFDIACMDTVLNDKFELKFLEVNFWCGYYCNMESVGDDNQFCQAFIQETSNILVEIYKKQKNGADLKNISSLNRFEMVHFEK